jgi:hypothetical protein
VNRHIPSDAEDLLDDLVPIMCDEIQALVEERYPMPGRRSAGII